mgnify:CR=1 FL=1
MSRMTEYAATLEDIHAAARRIAPYARHTPVMTCQTLDEMAGRQLFSKCEQFHKVGACEFRGACNAGMHLPDEVAARGVVTHSSGNHAQALALAARLREIPAHIVMPTNAPAVKRAAVEGYGARIVNCEPTQANREATAARVVEETGGTLIHPYDNADIIAGQGTVALELLSEIATLDAIITPVGGGGLLSGVCLAGKGTYEELRIFAGEPQGADAAARSLAAGQLVHNETVDTIADGLRTNLGERTWPIIRDHVEKIITVSDEEILSAMRFLAERAKLLVEPSAAVALAAVLSDEFKVLEGVQQIGIVLSGGNVELPRLT